MDIYKMVLMLESVEEGKQITESLSGFVYQIPKDPQELLFDFYMSTLLEPSGKDDNLDYTIEDTKKKLYPYLKQHMLEAMFFAICAEFSHAYDFIDNFDDKKFMIQSHNKRKIIPPYYYKNLKLILSAFKGKNFDFEDSDKNYKASNIAISKLVPAKMTPEDFIRTVEYIFSLDFVWPKSYGGKAWVRICKGWQHLATSKTLNDMMIWIDHCYDLQHNTGSIFIKLKEYYNNDSAYDWINYALDKKRDLKSPYAIWDDVSSQMRELAGFALKRSKGSTKERYDTVEKPEADQARQELKKLKNANKPKYKKPTDKPKPVTVYHRDGSYTIYRAFLSKHPYHALEFSAYQIEPPNSNEPSFIGSIVSVSKGKFVVRPLATMSGEEIVKAKLKEYPLKSIITKYEFGVENYTPKVT